MKRAIGYILCLGLLAGSAAAVNDGGTTSPFSLGAGSRDLALGGANVAAAGAYTSPHWNPARLARSERFELGAFHGNPYESDVAYQYLGLVAPTLDFGSFGLGVFRLGIDGIEKRDAGNLLLGEIEDSRLGFLFAYGRRLSGYDIGAALVMEHHSLDDYSATSSPGLNLAAQRRFEIGRSVIPDVTMAVVLRNLLQPKYKLDEENTSYPTTLTGGLTASIVPNSAWEQAASLSLALTKVDGADLKFAAGLEYGFYNLLYLRGGVRESRPSFGAGLSYSSFAFDYALVDRDMGSLHTFNLTTSFSTPVSEKRRLREAEREAAFNALMSDRLVAQNRETVSKLVKDGQNLVDRGDMMQARSLFDRALFICRANQMDTSEVYALYQETKERIDELNHKLRYRQYLDSADAKFRVDDYLAARYFANLALTEVSGAQQARDLLDKADAALNQSSSREETIQDRMLVIDSLLSYGHFDQALAVANSLAQIASEDSRVKQALKRATFERHRASSSNAFGSADYDYSIVVLDSALALFPGHQWCLDLREQARFAVAQAAEEPAVPEARPSPTISREVAQEVDQIYRQAQKSFEAGYLTAAIEDWERVEQLIPDYQSVREYLVNAYKYVGVDLYSKNRLTEAVAVWKKARRLAPDNREIASYIERTETEMRKLQELSYEHE